MAKKSPDELETINIRLVKGDYAKLGILFPKMKAGPAVRSIIHNFVERMEASKAPLSIDLDITILDEVME